MNKTKLLYMFAAISFVACSDNDSTIGDSTDVGSQSVVENAAADEPMAFATMDCADLMWETDDVTRGGSVDDSYFATDSIGVFCLAKRNIAADAKAISWSKPYSFDLYNKRIFWTENEMASVVATGDDKGELVWDDQHQLHYYDASGWYAYGFVAYHPWTPYVKYTRTTLTAYFKVDGNDDVIYAVASEPERTFGIDAVDTLAFSRSYYSKIRSQALDWEGTLPKLEFKHLLSRLVFNICLDEDPIEDIHVDRVEFDDFRCLITLPLANWDSSQGIIKNNITESTVVYTLNSNNDQLKKLELNDGTLLKDIDDNFASAFGHFELREKGETPISGIREGTKFKYNLSKDPKKIGDCILIPPVSDIYTKSSINLHVTLCDNNGNKYRNASALTLNVPAGGWKKGRSYDVNITLNAPDGYTSSAPGLKRSKVAPTTTVNNLTGHATVVPRQ